MTKRVVCVAFVAFFAGLAVAMPSRTDLKKVQSTVNELMAEDVSGMKSGKQTPEGAAAKAEELAGLATDEASKFLLYKGAFGLYVQGGKYEAAIAALDKLTAAVKDVPDKVLADIVRSKMKRLSKRDGGAIFAYYEQLDRRLRYGAEKEKLAKLVKANPSDREARKSLAVALAALDDWQGALAEFVQVGGDEQRAAKAEQAGSAAAAADLWWLCAAASDDDDVQVTYRAHAATLYAQAIRDGKLDGLKKALAEKRVTEVTGKDVESVAQAAQPKTEAQKEGAGQVSASQSADYPNVPIDTRKLSPIKIPLKGAPALEFVPIPAGTARLGLKGGKGLAAPLGVTITRPFLMAKIPLTFEQFYAITGWRLNIDKGLGTPADQFVYDKLGGSRLAGCAYLLSAEPVFETLNKKCCRHLPKNFVFRLPTLAEYEYVALGGVPGRFEKRHQWFEDENITPAELADLLKKAGAKLPDVQPGVNGERCLRGFEGVWQHGHRPVGTKRPNPYGVCDVGSGTWMLDRLSDADFNLSADWLFLDQIDRRKAGTVDPLFWTDEENFHGVQGSCCSVPMGFSQGKICGAIRIVIGSDLVAERKAKKR